MVKERQLKPHPHHSGYFRVGLTKEKKQLNYAVHQLVCMSFLNHIPNGFNVVVDHINGIKTDNRVDNLRLVSNRENTSFNNRKNFNNLTSKYIGVYFSKNSNKWISQIQFNNKLYNIGSFNNEIEASNQYKIVLSHIENGNFSEWVKNKKNKKNRCPITGKYI